MPDNFGDLVIPIAVQVNVNITNNADKCYWLEKSIAGYKLVVLA
jgi:hypothetical protein